MALDGGFGVEVEDMSVAAFGDCTEEGGILAKVGQGKWGGVGYYLRQC